MESPKYFRFRVLIDGGKKFLNRASEEGRAGRIWEGCACVNDTLIDPPDMLASLIVGREKIQQGKYAMDQTVRDLISSMKLQTM